MRTSKKRRDNSISGIEGSAQIELKAMFSKWGRSLEHEPEELLFPGLGREWVGNQVPCRTMWAREPCTGKEHSQQADGQLEALK